MSEPLVRKTDPFHVCFDFPNKEESPKMRCYSPITKWFITKFTHTEVWQYTAHLPGKKEKVYYIKAEDAKKIDSSITTERDFIKEMSQKVKRAISSLTPFKDEVRQLFEKAKNKFTTKEELKQYLEDLKDSGDPQKAQVAVRILAAFDQMIVESKAFSKPGHRKLDAASILRICIVAESVIATSGAEHVYLKKTEFGIKRSLLIDVKAKSWTVIVGAHLGTGTSKKVKTGSEVVIANTGRVSSASRRSLALAVNRKGQNLDANELAIAKLFSDETDRSGRGIASVRNIVSYSKTKNGVRVQKQIFAQEKALGDLHSYTPSSLTEIKSIASDCCYGLQRMIAKGYVHRDIKLANILLFADGAKLADFGLAGKESNQGVYGTYIAPEYFTNGGFHTHKADVYALGVALYHLRFKTDPPGLMVWTNVLIKDPATEQYVPHQPSIDTRVVEQKKIADSCLLLEQEYSRTGALSADNSLQLLIFRMLHPDPAQRPTAQQALQFLQNMP